MVKRLLVLEPKSRIGAQEALDHPWFDKYCPAITLKRKFKMLDEPKSSSKRLIGVETILSRANTLPLSEEIGGLFFH